VGPVLAEHALEKAIEERRAIVGRQQHLRGTGTRRGPAPA
jgi:hypothetical protein